MGTKLSITTIVLQNGKRSHEGILFLRKINAENIRQGLEVYALAETKSLDAENLCREVLDTFEECIVKSGTAAFTTVLSEAYQICHQKLADTLQDAPFAARVGLGLTTLAVLDDNLIFAKMGPGILYLQDSSGLREVQPPLLSNAQDETPNGDNCLGTALGPATIRVGHHTLSPGQTFIASTSTLGVASSYDGLYAILDSPIEESEDKLELLMGQEVYFAACLIKKGQR